MYGKYRAGARRTASLKPQASARTRFDANAEFGD
jgi:hypothetical protein